MLDRDTRRLLMFLFVMILLVAAFISGGWSAFQFSQQQQAKYIQLDPNEWVCKIRKSNGDCRYYQPYKN